MVYVDNYKGKLGRLIMSHMIADTRKELIEMVDKIGVQRKWIQNEGTDREHFDICQEKKKKAIEFGAININNRDFFKKMMSRGGDYFQ